MNGSAIQLQLQRAAPLLSFSWLFSTIYTLKIFINLAAHAHFSWSSAKRKTLNLHAFAVSSSGLYLFKPSWVCTTLPLTRTLLKKIFYCCPPASNDCICVLIVCWVVAICCCWFGFWFGLWRCWFPSFRSLLTLMMTMVQSLIFYCRFYVIISSTN